MLARRMHHVAHPHLRRAAEQPGVRRRQPAGRQAFAQRSPAAVAITPEADLDLLSPSEKLTHLPLQRQRHPYGQSTEAADAHPMPGATQAAPVPSQQGKRAPGAESHTQHDHGMQHSTAQQPGLLPSHSPAPLASQELADDAMCQEIEAIGNPAFLQKVPGALLQPHLPACCLPAASTRCSLAC